MSDETKAEVVKIGGRIAWRFPDGTILPYIAGGSGEGEGGEGSEGGEGGEGGEGNKKVEFTPEQQAHVDSIINKKFADVHTKAEAKAQGAIDELKAEIETLKASKEPGKAPNKSNDDLTALQDKISVLEADKIKGFHLSSESNIIAEASDLKAVNSRQVYELLKSQIAIADDGTRKVVNSEGQARMTEAGPMTEKELVTEFLTANPHFVQASSKSGGGSRTPEGGGDSDEDLSKLPLVEQLTAVREAKAAKNK